MSFLAQGFRQAWALSGRLAPRLALSPPCSSSCGASAASWESRRPISVEVRKGNVDFALRKLRRMMKVEGSIKEFRARKNFIKPSERKVLLAKQSQKRLFKKSVKAKLNWLIDRRERGF